MQAAQLDLAQQRFPAFGKTSAVFDDIYREDINIAVWQRAIESSLEAAVSNMLAMNPQFKVVLTLSPDNTREALLEYFENTIPEPLLKDVEQITKLFCRLFKLKQVRLRFETIKHTMCPRFHVDWVPYRLITSYRSAATEWLPHHAVDRSKLGAKSHGVADAESGLYSKPEDIKQLSCGDVAILKGELWPNNEEAGLVHRSPTVPTGEARLVLTLNVVKS